MIYNIEMRKIAFTAQKIVRLLPRPHIHTHLELIYITSGQSIVTLDSKQYTLSTGDIFLSFPNQLHFYEDQLSPIEGYMIIFTPETLPDFKKIFKSQIPTTPVWSDTMGKNIENRFKAIIKNLDKNTPLSVSIAKGYLLTIIGEMFSLADFVDKPGDFETANKILLYCMENYTKPLTLDYLSKELYLNKYYISHIFKERMNVSYKEFVTELRLNRACDLLKQNSSVTDAAYNSGFTSLKTFNRVFLKYMHTSPRDYAKKNKITKKDATH